MGAWGQDMFERDDDYGELALLLEHIISTIRAGFTLDNENWIYGEGDRGESQIMANIDILFTLCSHYETCPDITLAEVETWQRDYLATYDDLYSRRDVVDARPVQERRRFIKAAFDRLIDFIEDFNDTLNESDGAKSPEI